MSIITDIAGALSATGKAKEDSRAAGEGLWTYICRALCASGTNPDMPATVDVLETRFKKLLLDLADVRTLTKKDKNSLRSAKSVLKGAISNGVPTIWRVNADTSLYEYSDKDGGLLPLGKSELQNSKDDFTKVDNLMDSVSKLFKKDGRDTFDTDQLDLLMEKGLALLSAMKDEKLRIMADAEKVEE